MMEIDEPEQPRQQNAPIVDDDGFELVQSKEGEDNDHQSVYSYTYIYM